MICGISKRKRLTIDLFIPLSGRTLHQISLFVGVDRAAGALRSHDSGQWDAAMIVVEERQFRSAVAKSLVADAKCIFIPAKQFDHGGGHPWREVGIRVCTPWCRRRRRVDDVSIRGQAWEDGIGGREKWWKKRWRFCQRWSSSWKWSIVEFLKTIDNNIRNLMELNGIAIRKVRIFRRFWKEVKNLTFEIRALVVLIFLTARNEFFLTMQM